MFSEADFLPRNLAKLLIFFKKDKFIILKC